MSGTGKSTVLAELAKRGFATVETDVGPWSEWSDEAGGYVWNEELVGELLDGEHETTLFVSGTVSNQGRFYDRFDAVVLLSAPAEVLLERIDSRDDEPVRQVRRGARADPERPRAGRAAAPRDVHARARRDAADRDDRGEPGRAGLSSSGVCSGSSWPNHC